jgi:glycosyltransferase involved in cell wall biosynthesis
MKETIPSISVIIPVYNTEGFLVECLESIINQNFSDMEIIVVNDGSTDGSLDIIRRYSGQDKRIIILNKSNQGASAARNDAINMANADYIMFLDSDDIYKSDLVKTAYSRISGKACDILIFNGRAFEDDGEKKRWHKKLYFNLEEKDENHIAPGLYWIERTGGRIQQPGMKIYRRRFITENNIQFGNSLIGEDYFFFYMCMIKAKRVAYMHVDGYGRRYRSASHMTDESIRGTQERIKSFEQILTTLNFVQDEKCRRIISAQHAYYASVLWVNCLLRRNASERNFLLAEFQKARLDDYIRRNKHDWKLKILNYFISLPETMILPKINLAHAVKLIFKSQSRLL